MVISFLAGGMSIPSYRLLPNQGLKNAVLSIKQSVLNLARLCRALISHYTLYTLYTQSSPNRYKLNVRNNSTRKLA